MVHRFDVPLAARNRALHYLAHESKLSDEVRRQLTEVVHGYVGPCDANEARKGMVPGCRAGAEVLSDG